MFQDGKAAPRTRHAHDQIRLVFADAADDPCIDFFTVRRFAVFVAGVQVDDGQAQPGRLQHVADDLVWLQGDMR